jgi:hypothetical protein
VRHATAEEQSEVVAKLPLERGPVIRLGGVWSIVDGGRGCRALELMPQGEEPPLFAPARARRWPSGELLLWDGLEFESEAEEAARRALEDGRGLADVKGASAALRAAFAFAAAEAASTELGIPARPAELRRWVRDIAERGRAAADEALRALEHERAAFAARVAAERAARDNAREAAERQAQVEAARAARRAARRPRVLSRVGPGAALVDELEALVEDSLSGAGAILDGVRRLGTGLCEVRWRFGGERFVSVVKEDGLRVVDAGVCLAGADDWVTLDSLPSVVREAIDTDALVITRHGHY